MCGKFDVHFSHLADIRIYAFSISNLIFLYILFFSFRDFHVYGNFAERNRRECGASADVYIIVLIFSFIFPLIKASVILNCSIFYIKSGFRYPSPKAFPSQIDSAHISCTMTRWTRDSKEIFHFFSPFDQ